MMYWKYLKYVIKHKYYVALACFRVGLYWRGITHDLSKLCPSEFIPYARYFYGNYPSIEDVHGDARNHISMYEEDIDQAFDFAWLLHQKRNPHHWQWWVLPLDDGGTKVIPMSRDSIKELVADWIGAGRAISGREDPYPWYQQNKDNMQLHPLTRTIIEMHMNTIHDALNPQCLRDHRGTTVSGTTEEINRAK